jgi:carbon-monoxide dehydrogenase medium subunit
MLDLQAVLRPASAAEAVQALAGTQGRGLYVAGGTIVVPVAPKLDFLVDLTAAGLGGIRAEDAAGGSGVLVLGATLTIGDLLRSPEAGRPPSGLLRQTAAGLANHTVRNLATVAGNLLAWSFPTDLPPALLVLDATLVVAGPAGRRTITLEDFYARRRDSFASGDLVVEVRVPETEPGLAGAFEKMGRKRLDVALVNAAAAVRLEDGRIADARLAMNGVGGPPRRFRDVEGFLAGKPAEPDLFAEVARMVSASAEPRPSHRAGADYLKKLAGIAARRALMRAAGLIKEQ